MEEFDPVKRQLFWVSLRELCKGLCRPPVAILGNIIKQQMMYNFGQIKMGRGGGDEDIFFSKYKFNKFSSNFINVKL